MKYIMFEHKVKDTATTMIPVIFPNTLIHKDVAEAITEFHKKKYNADIKAVSAGEYNAQTGFAFGKSESLGLSSGKDDTQVINIIDYFPFKKE